MHRLSLILITLLSALQAQEYTLEPINVEAIQDVFTQTQSQSLFKNEVTLQERLKHNVSFDTVTGEKNGEGLSFRGIDKRATSYYEDGIPLYRQITGETATMSLRPTGEISIMNTSASFNGVSSMGADVLITTATPKKSLETMVSGTMSTNDERMEAYVGKKWDQGYLQANTSYYNMDDYTLSHDYTATPAQGEGKRRFSDRTQHDMSLKAGFYPDSHSHIAAKISSSRSHFGVSPNTHTDSTKLAGEGFGSIVPYDAFTSVPEKKLDSLYLYGDFTHGDIDTSVRAYYDRYEDIYAFYTDNNYSAYQNNELDTWSDSRLGASIKSTLNSSNHSDTLSLLTQRETHRWISTNAANGSHYSNDFLEASYLGEYTLSDGLQLEGALSYRILKPSQEFDTRKTHSYYETKDIVDYQFKATKTISDSSLYLAVAHKSRFPSMLEMYPLLPFEVITPSLAPEQSYNIEAGYSYSGWKHSIIALDVYRYDISDLIVKVNNAYINRDSALHYGAEGRLQTNIWPEHHMALSYRYAHTGDSTGDRIDLIPLHRFRAEETYDINSKWHTTLAYEHIGSRYSSYLEREYRLDPYHTLDLYLNYLQKSGISYRFGVKNLTDEAYEWRYGYPAQGINAFAALQWDL